MDRFSIAWILVTLATGVAFAGHGTAGGINLLGTTMQDSIGSTRVSPAGSLNIAATGDVAVLVPASGAANVWSEATGLDADAMVVASRFRQDESLGRLVRVYQAIQDPRRPVEPLYVMVETGNALARACPTSFSLRVPNANGTTSERVVGSANRLTCCIKVSRRSLDPWTSPFPIDTLRHEIGHVLMWEAYGRTKWPQSSSHGSHTTWSVADEGQALTEGWAEFVGTHYKGNAAWRWLDQVSAEAKELLIPVEDHTRAEGVVSSFFLQIAQKVKNPVTKIVKVFRSFTPDSVSQVRSGFGKLFPEDEAVVDRIYRHVFESAPQS